MSFHRKSQSNILTPSAQLIILIVLFLALMAILYFAVRGKLSDILVSMYK